MAKRAARRPPRERKETSEPLQNPRGQGAAADAPPKPWQHRMKWTASSADINKFRGDPRYNPFATGAIAGPPPGVVPAGSKSKLAMDKQVIEISGWAARQTINGAYFNGMVFPGFPYLSELALMPEYRTIAEVTATEMTREWIEFKSVSSDKSADQKIKELNDEMKKHAVRDHFRRQAELDSYFGRSHLYIDTGDGKDDKELQTSIGDGRDAATLAKFKGRKGFFKGLKSVEPIWCYPADYVSNDPLSQGWYYPQKWFALGKEMHVSRMLMFVGREVPDMLKPSYQFAGISMSQMAQPTINNWYRARNSVSDLLYRYSVNILKTQMDLATTEGAGSALQRARSAADFLNNNGIFMLDKESEDFVNVAAPLSGIDHLQAQAQEHISAVSRIPLVKLLGISPSGLNATSEFEMQAWYEWVKAYQEKFFTRHLNTVIALIMISLWGKVDEDIVWEFRPLRAMSAKELADIKKAEAETDAAYVEMGALDPTEVRERLESDPDSGYENLSKNGEDIEGTPEQLDLDLEEMFPRVARLDREREREGRNEPREPRARSERDQSRGARPRTARVDD